MSTPPQDNAWFNEVTKLISLTFLAKQVERLKKQITDVFRTMCVAFTFNWMSKILMPERHRALYQFPKLWGQPLNDAQSRLRMIDRQFRAQLSDTHIRINTGPVQANSMVPMLIGAQGHIAKDGRTDYKTIETARKQRQLAASMN